MKSQESRPKASDIKGEQLPYPAKQSDMHPAPDSDLSNYRAAGKLHDKIAIITGADSGIGRAVAVAFAKEGADVAIVYNENSGDAAETKRMVEQEGRTCEVIKADVRHAEQCKKAVQHTIKTFGRLNILVNNAAFQMAQQKLEDITEEQLRRTFETNIFAYFFMAQAALPHLVDGDCIINTGQHRGYCGQPDFGGLYGLERSYSCLYQIAGHSVRPQKHPRQLRSSRSGLDAQPSRPLCPKTKSKTLGTK